MQGFLDNERVAVRGRFVVSAAVVGVVVLSGVACGDRDASSTGDGVATAGDGTGEGSLEVDPELESCAAPGAPLVRLSSGEYRRSLRALVGDDALTRVANELARVPSDDLEDHGAFGREDHRVSDRHIEAWYAVADALAREVAADPELRREVLAGCAASSADADCLEQYGADLIRRAYRRPATAEELEALVILASAQSGEQRHHAMLFRVLMAPDFLYRFENAGTPVEGDQIALDDHELAARLAFHFWGAPPDDELWAAADAGELRGEPGYTEQVERVFADPRTRILHEEFFGEWLHVERGGFAEGPRLERLRDGIEIDGLAREMRAEVEAFVHYHIARDASWSEMLTSNYSFATSPRLAGIYGVEVWDGRSTPPETPEGERPGLLTRAGLLYTADGSTNPFRRGAFLRRSILCGAVAPPPANLPADALTPPEVVPGQSTRDAFEAKVDEPECQGCHGQFSDLGYGMESFDGLGRFRERERLVSVEGIDHGSASVDASVVPRIDASDDSRTPSTAAMIEAIAHSDTARHCLAETYMRFTLRRPLVPADACLVEAMDRSLARGAGVASALRDVAMMPQFKYRRLDEEDRAR